MKWLRLNPGKCRNVLPQSVILLVANHLKTSPFLFKPETLPPHDVSCFDNKRYHNYPRFVNTAFDLPLPWVTRDTDLWHENKERQG